LYSSDFSLWSLPCVGFPWSVENKNCWTRMNCHYCRFLACCDRPGAALSPLPRSSEIRDAVGTYRVSLRTWFCSLEEGAARAALQALQLGLGLGYLLDSWCAQSDALFRDHTTDAARGASSERESRCRSAVSILAYRTISFPGHFWFCFSLKESFLGQFSGCCRGSYAPFGTTDSQISLFFLYSPSLGSFARPEMDLKYLFRQCSVVCF
jgi:hypothetical protein